MSCGGFDFSSAYLWISASGLLTGAALRYILVPAAKRKAALFPLFLSLALLSALAAFFTAGAGDITNEALFVYLKWFGVFCGTGYVSFRFPKAAGLPLLFVFAAFLIYTWNALYSWSCVAGQPDICSFYLASEGEGYIRVRYDLPDGTSEIERIDGTVLIPRIQTLDIPDWLFIVKVERMYRFHGFSSAETKEDNLPGLLTALPGIRIGTPETAPLRPAPSVSYQLRFGREGNPEIIRIIE